MRAGCTEATKLAVQTFRDGTAFEAIGRRYYIIVNRWKTADGEAHAGMMLTRLWRGRPKVGHPSLERNAQVQSDSDDAGPQWGGRPNMADIKKRNGGPPTELSRAGQGGAESEAGCESKEMLAALPNSWAAVGLPTQICDVLALPVQV